jgi:hypothetical protein
MPRDHTTRTEPVKGRGRCPKCASRSVRRIHQNIDGVFYGRTIEVCLNCEALWEPMPDGGDHADSDGSPFPFPEPCDNCAFRPGSPEQKDAVKWKEMIDQLAAGGQFYCHKGVPIDPGSEDGFAYPKKRDAKASALAGETVMVHDKRKLRLCRGYLNMMSRIWAKEFGSEIAAEIGTEVQEGQ